MQFQRFRFRFNTSEAINQPTNQPTSHLQVRHAAAQRAKIKKKHSFHSQLPPYYVIDVTT
jgi:hypothetical protein